MTPTDEQVELLRGIWSEMKALNGRVTTTNEQLGEVRAELRSGLADVRAELRAGLTEVRAGLDEVRGSIGVLGERIDLAHTRSVERDLRIATALTEVAGEVHELRGDVHDLRLDVRCGLPGGWRPRTRGAVRSA